jgi:hypothetical protein
MRFAPGPFVAASELESAVEPPGVAGTAESVYPSISFTTQSESVPDVVDDDTDAMELFADGTLPQEIRAGASRKRARKVRLRERIAARSFLPADIWSFYRGDLR